MNWIDGILLILLLASVIVGSKKGLIRELMAFAVFFIAIIIAVNYVDGLAIWIFNKTGTSPLISAFMAFIVLLAASYAIFKIIGLLFYKIADLKQNKKRDQMGGALVGFLRGWVMIGFVTFLTFLLPQSEGFYSSFEESFFGSAVAKTIPLMYEGTSTIHPSNPNFIEKIESTLMVAQSSSDHGASKEDRLKVYRVLQQMRRFFDLDLNDT